MEAEVIVIDTNVISEMMRPEPDVIVLAWANAVEDLHTTAITIAEVEYGIARLPAGRRKDRLVTIITDVFADFRSVTLPFDTRAAHAYAEIVADRERARQLASASSIHGSEVVAGAR